MGKGVAIIFQDSQNDYWFASNGMVRYDGKNLTQCTKEDGLYSNRISGIQEDKSGNIYFDTGEGINKFGGRTIEKLILRNNLRNLVQSIKNANSKRVCNTPKT